MLVEQLLEKKQGSSSNVISMSKLVAKGSKRLRNFEDIFMTAKEKESSDCPFWALFKD